MEGWTACRAVAMGTPSLPGRSVDREQGSGSRTGKRQKVRGEDGDVTRAEERRWEEGGTSPLQKYPTLPPPQGHHFHKSVSPWDPPPPPPPTPTPPTPCKRPDRHHCKTKALLFTPPIPFHPSTTPSPRPNPSPQDLPPLPISSSHTLPSLHASRCLSFPFQPQSIEHHSQRREPPSPSSKTTFQAVHAFQHPTYSRSEAYDPRHWTLELYMEAAVDEVPASRWH